MGRRLVLLACATTLLASSAWAERLYSVRVRTNPRGAVVYVENREAGVRGTTPHRLRLPRGKHKIILEAPGHEPLETVVDVRRSDTFTFTLSKERPKAKLRVLTLEPDAAAGTTVLINGKAEGSLPGSFTLPAGSHLIAVHKPGYVLWQQWVELRTGDQRTVTVALVAEGPKTGTLLIASNTPGAKIFVDGKPVGDSPALVHKIPEGAHTVEVRAEGHPPKSKKIQVVPDQTTKVVIDQAIPVVAKKKSSTLRVLATQQNVDVYVDGDFRGKAPVTIGDLKEGTHIVVGQLAGYQPAEKRIEISAAKVQTIKLALEKVGPVPAAGGQGTLAVQGTNGARVLIDGAPVGIVPLEAKDVPAGKHVVTIELSGHRSWTSPVELRDGQRVVLSVLLQAQIPASAPSSQRTEPAVDPHDDDETIRGLSSYGAQLVPPRYFTADVSVGFPHLAEGRLTTGVHDWEWLAVDAGVEVRSYGAFTEFDVISKVRLLFHEPIALATFIALGGGGGPKARNTFFMNVGATVSLMFKKILTFTGRVYGNFYTDRLCPSSEKGGELAVCDDTQKDGQSPRDRYAGARLMLTALLEVPITTNIGGFLLIEGAPFQDQRMSLTDDFASLMPETDPRVYGRLGATFKF